MESKLSKASYCLRYQTFLILSQLFSAGFFYSNFLRIPLKHGTRLAGDKPTLQMNTLFAENSIYNTVRKYGAILHHYHSVCSYRVRS